MICIIDYGAGNLKSVANALAFLDIEHCVSSDKDIILSADKAILPGVGAFGDAMDNLKRLSLTNTIYDCITSGKEFLGICLGMQMLFETSEESPGVSGLGIFKGDILRLPSVDGLKIPHIGWNSLEEIKSGGIFEGIEGRHVYFVHSFYLKAADEAIVACKTDYAVRFHSAIEKGCVHAAQFHPEKSGTVGLGILKRFSEL